jgi:pantoate--beta-alanine ligase
MRTLRTISGLRTALHAPRREGARIGLVPTMGALHDGHLSLIRRARTACDVVVVTLFVNPAQFDEAADLGSYPRDEARDANLAREAGADLLFAPAAGEIYPPGFATSVSVGDVSASLEGEARGAGHFAAVATVVAKLLNIAQPDVAYFGQKDAQQALVVRKLVRDLDIPVAIDVCPTVREPDGLAMSSRNSYLDPGDRERASALRRALVAAEAAVAAGEVEAPAVLQAARAELVAAGVEPEYLELRSATDLSTVERVNGSTLLAVAARIGRARLIDNAILEAR